MRATFVGEKILTGYYGMTLLPGEPFDVPERLEHKIRNTPSLFTIVEGDDDKPRRRGRPRKKDDE